MAMHNENAKKNPAAAGAEATGTKFANKSDVYCWKCMSNEHKAMNCKATLEMQQKPEEPTKGELEHKERIGAANNTLPGVRQSG